MVADDSPRETLLVGMRYERLRGTTLYRHLYRAIPQFLASPIRDRGILERCRVELQLKRETATSPQAADNAIYALRALETFERSLNALPIAGWTLERAPLARPLKFSNVSVSVQPTVHIRVRRSRYADQAGALLIDPAKGESVKTAKAKARATDGMQISSILLHQYAVGIFPTADPKASAAHCIVFHTHRQELAHCPENYRRKLHDIEAACANISRGWDAIAKPPDFDPDFAIYRN